MRPVGQYSHRSAVALHRLVWLVAQTEGRSENCTPELVSVFAGSARGPERSVGCFEPQVSPNKRLINVAILILNISNILMPHEPKLM